MTDLISIEGKFTSEVREGHLKSNLPSSDRMFLEGVEEVVDIS